MGRSASFSSHVVSRHVKQQVRTPGRRPPHVPGGRLHSRTMTRNNSMTQQPNHPVTLFHSGTTPTILESRHNTKPRLRFVAAGRETSHLLGRHTRVLLPSRCSRRRRHDDRSRRSAPRHRRRQTGSLRDEAAELRRTRPLPSSAAGNHETRPSPAPRAPRLSLLRFASGMTPPARQRARAPRRKRSLFFPFPFPLLTTHNSNALRWTARPSTIRRQRRGGAPKDRSCLRLPRTARPHCTLRARERKNSNNLRTKHRAIFSARGLRKDS